MADRKRAACPLRERLPRRVGEAGLFALDCVGTHVFDGAPQPVAGRSRSRPLGVHPRASETVPGRPTIVWAGSQTHQMDPNVDDVDVDVDEQEERLERVAAIDVAKASGKVCTRVPHASVERRRVTKVWDVATTTNALMNLGDELAEMGIERVVVESTSDYWRPFFYLLEARGLVVSDLR